MTLSENTMKNTKNSIIWFLCLTLFLFILNNKIFSFYDSYLDQEYIECIERGDKLKTEGEFDKAKELFERSLNIAKEIKNEKMECESLLKLGLLYWILGERDESSKKYEQALKIAQKSNLKNEQGACQNALKIYRLYREADEFLSSGEYKKSVESFRKAIELAEKIGSKEHKARCMRQMSIAYWELNKFKEFCSLNEEVLNIAQELKHRKEIGRCLNNIGLYYWKINNYFKALTYFEAALKIAVEERNEENESYCLNNMGLIYQEIGKYDRALEFLFKALTINEDLENRSNISGNLNTIGETYRRMALISRKDEDFDKALNYFKESLSLTKEISERKTEVQVLNNIGSACSEKGTLYLEQGYENLAQKEYQNALEYFNKALKKAEEIQDFELMGFILTNMGIVHYNQGNYDESTNCYDRVINLPLESGEQILWETHFEKARNSERQQKYDEALESYKLSIRYIEEIRSNIELEELKAKYLGTDKRIDCYHYLINLLVTLHNSEPEKGFNEESFNFLERAKARAILDKLLEFSNIDITQLVDPELLNREKDLEKDISLLHTKLLNTNLGFDEKNIILQKLKEKENEMESLKVEIWAEIPSYAAIKYPKIISVKEAQDTLPDKNTVFIAYCIGKEYSYAFVISKKDLKIFPLPARDEIKKQVKEFLTVINDKETNNFQGGYELYKMLVSPGLDENIKTIIFIPDDILNFLPFETLITDNEKKEWLIEKYDISYAPSITSLREIIQRKKEKRPSKQILAFGDPYFGSLEREGNGNDAIKEFYSLSSDISRLTFSGVEIDKIGNVFKKASLFQREEATEDSLKKQKLEEYRVIHFATHSIIDDKIPSRSSIVLSLDEDPNEDGFLRMDEIYNLHFNSDLVTLSACETGLGEFIHGEGIVGINRAFFYAGTSAVLMSLWAVNDQASYQLMERFYRHLRSSESIMDALRKVKLEMINSQALSHPYYWAGFIVSGKADEIVFSRSTNKFILFGISFLVLVGIILATVKSIKKRS